ncbi:MAG: DUF6456 domain-containing protein [Maritimibacter sp.]
MAARTRLHSAPMRGSSVTLPKSVQDYLVHTVQGVSIRAIARQHGDHASTVLRHIRRLEQRRDDPLFDKALTQLGNAFEPRGLDGISDLNRKDAGNMNSWTKMEPEKLARESLLVLRAMSEPGALLVIAQGVEGAIVVKSGTDNRPVRRAITSQDVAEYLSVSEWITLTGTPGAKVARYSITSKGRGEFNRLMAHAESARAAGLEEGDLDAARGKVAAKTQRRARRSAGADAPIHVLARRKRAGGTPFLSPQMVQAAERFRESFEIAQLHGQVTQDWEALLQGNGGKLRAASHSTGAEAQVDRRMTAEASLAKAIAALGPELAECVILSCCHEHGMETIEDKLDYPARSGKIVLRIALATLERHYATQGADTYNLIY